MIDNIKKFDRSSLFIGIFFLLHFNSLFASSWQNIEINGLYNEKTQEFTGTATYNLTSPTIGQILFHLPANYYTKPDRREEYWTKSLNGKNNKVSRSELNKLNDYHQENFHLPIKISVTSVYINDRKIPFKIIHNPELPPLKNHTNTLLSIDLQSLEFSSGFQIVIQFSTKFHKLPSGYRRILLDFAPRPVMRVNQRLDMGDFYRLSSPTTTKIKLLPIIGSQIESDILTDNHDSIPVCLIDNWSIEEKGYKLSVSKYLSDRLPYYKRRIELVLEFLVTADWLDMENLDFSFFVWDGPLYATGNNIFLPREILRYNKLFYKSFEILILRGILASIIRRHHFINSYQYPWIIPALQAEIIRDYVDKNYQGNSRYFPWQRWLNPDYYQENTIKNWINQNLKNTVISAASSMNMQFYNNIFHPWYEKGFHMLRVLNKQDSPFKAEYYPLLKSVLKQNDKAFSELDANLFFSIFAPDAESRARGEKWLSDQGMIDYGISSVTIDDTEVGFVVDLEIVDNGTVSPVIEVEFKYNKDTSKRELITRGAGRYRFVLDSRPNEIILDPDHQLLEDYLLNNQWSVPINIRPFWDVPSSDRWLLSLYPVLGGNVFDRNLIGIGVDLSYLEKFNLSVNAWRSDSDEELLWESYIAHSGFPWHGTKLYFNTSQLNAGYSKTVGLLQDFSSTKRDTVIDLFLTDEKLEYTEKDDVPTGWEEWVGGEIEASSSIFRGNFSEWTMLVKAIVGESKKQPALRYQQQSFSQLLSRQFSNFGIHLKTDTDMSYGTVPLQKRYPMGGPEGVPGFPRDTDLMFYHRRILTIGSRLPSFFTHTNLNLFRISWLQRVEPTLNFHWGQGFQQGTDEIEHFQDVELQFDIHADLFNLFQGHGTISFAQPIGHDNYKDMRIILFSDWVF